MAWRHLNAISVAWIWGVEVADVETDSGCVESDLQLLSETVHPNTADVPSNGGFGVSSPVRLSMICAGFELYPVPVRLEDVESEVGDCVRDDRRHSIIYCSEVQLSIGSGSWTELSCI